MSKNWSRVKRTHRLWAMVIFPDDQPKKKLSHSWRQLSLDPNYSKSREGSTSHLTVVNPFGGITSTWFAPSLQASQRGNQVDGLPRAPIMCVRLTWEYFFRFLRLIAIQECTCCVCLCVWEKVTKEERFFHDTEKVEIFMKSWLFSKMPRKLPGCVRSSQECCRVYKTYFRLP